MASEAQRPIRLPRLGRVGWGTYFFVYVNDDFAAAAIDSRENIGDEHRDNICKITLLDDYTIFLCQGIARGEGFSAGDIARGEFAQQLKPLDLYKLASDWANEMTKQIKILYERDRDIVEDMKPNAAGGVFLGYTEVGNVSAVQVQIEVSNSVNVTTFITALPPDSCPRTGGHDPIVEEVLAGDTNRARKLRASINLTGNPATNWAIKAQTCVKAVIDWGDDRNVGGEVATLILERGQKWRWFHRPDFCPEN